jgi:hypothetical protein
MRNVSRRNPDLSVASFVLHILLYAHPSISDKKKEKNKHWVFTFEEMNIACKAMLALKHCIILLQTLHFTDDSVLCFKPLTRVVFYRGKVNTGFNATNPGLQKKRKHNFFFVLLLLLLFVLQLSLQLRKKYQSTITNLSSSVGKIVRWFEKI